MTLTARRATARWITFWGGIGAMLALVLLSDPTSASTLALMTLAYVTGVLGRHNHGPLALAVVAAASWGPRRVRQARQARRAPVISGTAARSAFRSVARVGDDWTEVAR